MVSGWFLVCVVLFLVVRLFWLVYLIALFSVLCWLLLLFWWAFLVVSVGMF